MSKASFRSRIFGLVTLSMILMIYGGCSDDESPVSSDGISGFTITFGSSSSLLNLSDFPVYTIEEQQAVKLSDLIDTSVVTEPDNYAYRFVGSDGFYAHVKGNPDNTWDHLQDGYIVVSTMKVTFDTALGLISRYNIKDAGELKILRKIDFITPADSLIQHIVDELPHAAFEDSLTGIALTEFIPEEVVNSPALYVYELVTVDEFSKTLSYEQVKEGFYVIEHDRILYTNPEIPGSLKIKMLNRMIAKSPPE